MIDLINTPENKNQKKVIDKIRAGFGIGLGRGIGKTEQNLHRAIKHLSRDLYSKDIHFILELIQNAEDNDYAPGTEPQLIFKIMDKNPLDQDVASGAFLVINNEKGFTDQNVNAICSIGDTTKKKRDGYIGEKGIGFKSVFLVSKHPHIFSSGYHFSFTEDPDEEVDFGFIVPYWVDDVPQQIKPLLNQTCILLPLRPEKRDIVAAELHQIAPETILFLKEIKVLKIFFDDDPICEVRRNDKQYSIVDLNINEKMHTYFLSEVNFSVPSDIEEEKREGINERPVSIAFPIKVANPPEIGVYAFLPTSTNIESGFDFIINADFILTSNREQIQENLVWNQWLRDCLSDVFVKGFKDLLRIEEYRFKAYSYIPLRDSNRNPFFSPPVAKILEELYQLPVIFTEDKKWVKPHQARFASKEIRRILFGHNLPRELNEIKLISSELEEVDFKERLESLGVVELSEEEFLNCLHDDEWIVGHDALWYFELYKYLETQEWVTKQKLADVKLIPTSNGEIVSPSDYSGIYKPSEDAYDLLIKHHEVAQLSNILLLNQELFNLLQQDSKVMLWASEKCGLTSLDNSMICRELAIKLNQLTEEVELVDLLKATKFIVYHWNDLSDRDKRVIRGKLPLLLDGDKIILSDSFSEYSPLVFPEAFNQKSGWQLIFPESEDRAHMSVISDKYLDGEKKSHFPLWEEFFNFLGATQTPFPKLLRWNVTNSYPNDAPDYLRHFRDKHRSTRDKVLKDWKVPSWLLDFSNEDKNNCLIRARALIRWLEYQRDDLNSWRYPDWKWAKVECFYRQGYEGRETSKFNSLIHNSPWMPTNKGFKKPAQVFINRQDIKEVLDDSFPITDLKLSEELCEFLNIKTELSFSELLKYLESLAEQPASEADFEVVSKLYSLLSDRWNEESKEIFYDKKMILLMDPKPQWYRADQVIWENRSDVFEDTFGYLNREYSELKSFFQENIEVMVDVDTESYGKAWQNLIENQDRYERKKVEAGLAKIYEVLEEIAEADEKPSWWNAFKENIKIWTQSGKFVDPSEVFILDDTDLQSIFCLFEIEYVWWPSKNSFNDFLSLFYSLGVRSLTKSVDINTSSNGINNDVESTSFFSNVRKKAICCYLRHKFPKNYDHLKENGILKTLLQTQESLVNTLSLEFSLDHYYSQLNNGITFWDQNGGILYLSMAYSEEKWAVDAPNSIAKKLSFHEEHLDLEDFIGRNFGLSTPEIEQIIDKRNWHLPEKEELWIDSVLEAQKEINLNQFDTDKSDESTSDKDEIEEIRVAIEGFPEQELGEPTERKGQSKRNDVSHFSGTTVTQSSSRTGRQSSQNKIHREKRYAFVYSEKALENRNEEPGETDNLVLGRIGEQKVMDFEKNKERSPRNMNTIQVNFSGYDIESTSKDGSIRYIEVKSFSGNCDSQTPARLTKTEFDKAKSKGKSYWLYIVEWADTDHFKIHPIEDPANKVDYYFYDHSWFEKKGFVI